MKPRELRTLIGRGESQNLEFKEKVQGKIDKGLQSLCGMLNTPAGHGCVLFGVADNGEITGIEQGNADALEQTINSGCSPQPSVMVERCTLSRSTVGGAQPSRAASEASRATNS